MKILKETNIEGVRIIRNFFAEDDRGIFVKVFNKKYFSDNGVDFEARESYYSISSRNVIRGMHFQTPPFDHEKLVYVPYGKISDVMVDLRQDSKTFRNVFSVELSSENRTGIFIPKGVAHGFRSLEDNSITVYTVSTEYKSEHDLGIKYDSIDFDWGTEEAIISKRDMSFQPLKEFLKKKIF